jgi:hypothetical protein
MMRFFGSITPWAQASTIKPINEPGSPIPDNQP